MLLNQTRMEYTKEFIKLKFNENFNGSWHFIETILKCELCLNIFVLAKLGCTV